nr:hypothetical protein [uncultured Butyrivibrio sp.]
MRFFKEEEGTLLRITNGESNLYEIYKELASGNYEMIAEQMMKLLGSSLLKFGITDYEPGYFYFGTTNENEILVYATCDKAYDGSRFDHLTELFYQIDKEDMENFDDTEMSESIMTQLSLKSNVEKFVKDNPRLFEDSPIKWAATKCDSRIYKVPLGEAKELKPIAEYFLYKGSDFYVKVKKGIVLDDFYERGNIIEGNFYKITCDQF